MRRQGTSGLHASPVRTWTVGLGEDGVVVRGAGGHKSGKQADVERGAERRVERYVILAVA